MSKNLKIYFLFLSVLFSTGFYCVTLKAQAVKQKKIGNKVWMTQNLNVTTFRNGDAIPQAKTIDQWIKAGEQKKPAWCYYNNSASNAAKYGRLYNWYAVNDPRGLAPKGWHIPTEAEWSELIDTLNKLGGAADMMKTATGWKNYESGGYTSGESCEYCNGTGERYSSLSGRIITCAVCGGSGGDKTYYPKKTYSGNGNNKSGFCGSPGGFRHTEGEFYRIGEYGFWWTATEKNSDEAMHCTLLNSEDYVERDSGSKVYGFSIRCIKD